MFSKSKRFITTKGANSKDSTNKGDRTKDNHLSNGGSSVRSVTSAGSQTSSTVFKTPQPRLTTKTLLRTPVKVTPAKSETPRKSASKLGSKPASKTESKSTPKSDVTQPNKVLEELLEAKNVEIRNKDETIAEYEARFEANKAQLLALQSKEINQQNVQETQRQAEELKMEQQGLRDMMQMLNSQHSKDLQELQKQLQKTLKAEEGRLLSAQADKNKFAVSLETTRQTVTALVQRLRNSDNDVEKITQQLQTANSNLESQNKENIRLETELKDAKVTIVNLKEEVCKAVKSEAECRSALSALVNSDRQFSQAHDLVLEECLSEMEQEVMSGVEEVKVALMADVDRVTQRLAQQLLDEQQHRRQLQQLADEQAQQLQQCAILLMQLQENDKKPVVRKESTKSPKPSKKQNLERDKENLLLLPQGSPKARGHSLTLSNTPDRALRLIN